MVFFTSRHNSFNVMISDVRGREKGGFREHSGGFREHSGRNLRIYMGTSFAGALRRLVPSLHDRRGVLTLTYTFTLTYLNYKT